MPLNETFTSLLIALGLGLLVGLQKERSKSLLAGLKTFGLVTVFGAMAAVLSTALGPWIVVGGLLSVTALMVTGNYVLVHEGSTDPGQTTEVAIALMYLVGVLAVIGPMEVAIVLGSVTAVLLHLREELKSFVQRLTDRDVHAFMQFVLISLVILPVLPDRTYGPFQVLNPRQIWWMVVLIVGINVAGYAALRLFGARAGTALAGLLGGVVSSTATTFSYARTTRTQPERSDTAVAIVWIASGVVFVRILIEVAAVAPGFVGTVAGPMIVMLLVFAILAAVVWHSAARPGKTPLDPGNPSELKPALLFAAMYAAVLLAVAAAARYLGGAGLYAAAAISGLTDIDAITLSTSQLVEAGRVEASVGWRLILVASLSNLAFKVGVVSALGSRAMLRRFGSLVATAVAVGVALLWFWG